MKNTSDFIPFFTVDKHDLDTELIRQPELVWHANYQTALVRQKAEKLRVDMKELLGKVESEIRVRFDVDGTKVTEKAVAAEVDSAPSVIGIRKEIARMNRRLEEWDGVKAALSARGHTLRELCALYRENYYASDKAYGAEGNRQSMNAKRQASQKRERSSL